jgi:threonine/homoserine/homoserine lactone efflux protein
VHSYNNAFVSEAPSRLQSNMEFLGITGFGLFCAAVLLLNATPGPDTAYIVGRSVAQGRSAGLISAVGISVGCCVHAIASAFGLSAILATSATAFTIIKVAGGLYLVYLGMRMLLTPSANVLPAGAAQAIRPLRTVFWQAVLTNVLNPKVVLFFLSFFPQFVRADAPDQTLAFLLLGVVFVAISTVWNSGTALLAGTLAQRAGRNPQIRLWLERTVGAAFVALGIKLALSRD